MTTTTTTTALATVPPRSRKATALNRSTATSLITYAAGILEACRLCGIEDAITAIEEPDRFPKFQKISEVEWMTGWFHGVAEANGITIPALWAEAIRLAHEMKNRPPRKYLKTTRKAA